MSSRIKGLVKWYNESKGFGFISPLDGSKDIAVNYSALHGDNFNTLFEGQKLNLPYIAVIKVQRRRKLFCAIKRYFRTMTMRGEGIDCAISTAAVRRGRSHP